MDIAESVRRVAKFEGDALTKRLSSLETALAGLSREVVEQECKKNALDPGLLEAASVVKGFAGQINVVIHAAGILVALPAILEGGERVESLSLGAGNTGKAFDLETDRRVAEFKFITWRGGPESIRQNSLFKDFYGLAEADTQKRRCLFVLGLDRPLSFLTGQRSLGSVMSRNAALAADRLPSHSFTARMRCLSRTHCPKASSRGSKGTQRRANRRVSQQGLQDCPEAPAKPLSQGRPLIDAAEAIADRILAVCWWAVRIRYELVYVPCGDDMVRTKRPCPNPARRFPARAPPSVKLRNQDPPTESGSSSALQVPSRSSSENTSSR